MLLWPIVFANYEDHRATDKYQRICQEQITKVPARAGEQNAPGTHECKDPKEYMPWWYVLVAWPDGIGEWALIATGFVIGWQSWETRGAARAAQASVQAIIDKERARLRIEVRPFSYEVQAGPTRRLKYSATDIARMPSDEMRRMAVAKEPGYMTACEFHSPNPPGTIGPEVEYTILHDGETSAFIEAAVADVQLRDTDHVKYEEAFNLMKLPEIIKRASEPLERYALIFPICRERCWKT